MAAAKKYDLILMDLQMPEMDGFEAARIIRASDPSIPMIALTADIRTDDVQQAKAAGMEDYIEKPIDEKLLYAKVTKAVDKPLSTEEAIELLKKDNVEATAPANSGRDTNLAYLQQRTGDDPGLMKEMIRQYLKQTPMLLEDMRASIERKDWDGLYDALHKMIPSFWIMGINSDFQYMAKTLKDSAENKENLVRIPELFAKLENVCNRACRELEEELKGA
jgi:YesN/AraC family two-component response regulator